MNLVFMNSLEKKKEDGRVQTAQVLIQEQHGVWQVVWNEPSDRGRTEQDRWFEGSSWDVMLSTFRFRLAEKMADGYTPLLSDIMDSSDADMNRFKTTRMLQYYSELHKQEEVYQRLRAWRTEQASKEGNAPYLVATNRILSMLSTFLPKDKKELLQIPGFGEKKVEMYGDAVLAITSSGKREHQFPLDWVYDQIDQQKFKQWVYKQKEQKYKKELEQQGQRRTLLQAIQDGKNIGEITKSYDIPRRDVVVWIERLDQEGYDLDAFLTQELSRFSEEKRNEAWNAYKELGDRYLKPVMQKIYSEDERKDLELDQVYEWLRLLRIQFRRQKEQQESTRAS